MIFKYGFVISIIYEKFRNKILLKCKKYFIHYHDFTSKRRCFLENFRSGQVYVFRYRNHYESYQETKEIRISCYLSQSLWVFACPHTSFSCQGTEKVKFHFPSNHILLLIFMHGKYRLSYPYAHE